MTDDQHPASAVAHAIAEIGAPWATLWFGWGALIAEWLQILALITTIVFTVMRGYALWLRLSGKEKRDADY